MKYFVGLLILLVISCTKDKSCETCTSATITANSTIIDGGSPAGDGCGWLIQLPDSAYYHPDVLDVSFQHNGLPVSVSYQSTSDSFVCGLAAAHLPVIHVNSIRKRQGFHKF